MYNFFYLAKRRPNFSFPFSNLVKIVDSDIRTANQTKLLRYQISIVYRLIDTVSRNNILH